MPSYRHPGPYAQGLGGDGGPSSNGIAEVLDILTLTSGMFLLSSLTNHSFEDAMRYFGTTHEVRLAKTCLFQIWWKELE